MDVVRVLFWMGTEPTATDNSPEKLLLIYAEASRDWLPVQATFGAGVPTGSSKPQAMRATSGAVALIPALALQTFSKGPRCRSAQYQAQQRPFAPSSVWKNISSIE